MNNELSRWRVSFGGRQGFGTGERLFNASSPEVFRKTAPECYEVKKNGKYKCMYGGRRNNIRSQPKRYDPPEKKGDLRRNLTTSAEVDPGQFWIDHYAISQSRPKEVSSLSNDEGPTSFHWQNGSDT